MAKLWGLDLEAKLPKSIRALRNYNAQTFSHDFIAGVTVGLVALPLAMAFSISSGMSPQAGIYTAIVAGFLSSLLGGSQAQVSGPTGAFVVVVAGIVAEYGAEGLFVCTAMAGILLVVLGLTGLGSAVKFLPRPVIVGFTNGIAVLIASTQIKDFFGLRIDKVPGDFMGRIASISAHFGTLSVGATVLASLALAGLIVFRKFVPRVPGAIVILVAGTAAAFFLHLPIETIRSRFHGIPQGLPGIHLPHVTLNQAKELLSPAITVAMLGAIESLMSAVVSDRMIKDKHNPNVELIAQGIANIASPLFGGLPSTGAIARTATNIRSGARTPVAGMIHAFVLLVILLVAAPLADQIPLSLLAAILVMVSYNMGEWKEIPQILKLSPADILVWAVTFGLTVFADLTVAVQSGMILAALLYINKVTRTTTVVQVTNDYLEDGRDHMLHFRELPDGVAIFRIHGPFLFGSTDKIAEILDRESELPPVVVLRLRNMTAIDGTGVQALEELTHQLVGGGRHVLFCGMREQPAQLMHKVGFEKHVGPANICANVKEALKRAEELLRNETEQLNSAF
jgi:SulP family sulfate permease